MLRHSLFVLAVAAAALAIGGLAVTAQGLQPQPTVTLSPASASGTGFTYQGLLNKNVAAYNGTCDMQFSLWDSLANNTGQLGITEMLNTVGVSNGRFTVLLNETSQFGASAFSGDARWLQIALKCAGDVAPVVLTRQLVSATPYVSGLNSS